VSVVQKDEGFNMDRMTWLRDMRRDCEEQYDTRWAPHYGEKWGLYSNTTHLQFMREFLSLLPQSSRVLDAACGAGRYLPYLLEKGHSVLGIDQSQGMLKNAGAKFPGVQFEKVGLQEMAYQEVFDGAICMDAMENVCPEDWSLVLNNFHRALKPYGYLYFTAETIENADENEIRQAFEKAQQAGLPVVYGEWPDNEEVYHYHPTNDQVKEWVRQTGFEILKEGNGEIYYYHVLARKVGG
jgi:SAM-dependent methyltransferase